MKIESELTGVKAQNDCLFYFIFQLAFNVEGYSCDVTHGLDFSTIASPIKI